MRASAVMVLARAVFALIHVDFKPSTSAQRSTDSHSYFGVEIPRSWHSTGCREYNESGLGIT